MSSVWSKLVNLATNAFGVLSPANGGTGVANNAAATLTRSGNHALTVTTSATTNVTFPAGTFTAESQSNKGVAGGYASLDGGGKVPVTQLPASTMDYLGTWDASTNTPTLADGTGSAGDVYIVSVAGTQNLGSGSITFAVGDWVIYSGSIWQKASNGNSVASVNGFTGIVTLTATDVGALSDTASGEIDDPAFFTAGAVATSSAAGIVDPYSAGTGVVYAGTYSPTPTNVTNIIGSTTFTTNYMRVGKMVTVSGKVNIDVNALGAFELGLSLPVASDFTAAEDLGGSGAGNAGLDGFIINADATNNRASITGIMSTVSNTVCSFIFMYQIK
jgi:hypothetical protein